MTLSQRQVRTSERLANGLDPPDTLHIEKRSEVFLRKLGKNPKYLGTLNERKPAEGPVKT